ncbi:MAG TPA: efflux RND transporter periplasmic adaptor subunit [Vicinamibacterales bacterium]|nr:efflux RND transporter periplasmic adaptor subunit [Vicinamibacterales bacterium]
MTRKKWIIGGLVVVGLGAVAAANLSFQRTSGTSVTTEAIEARSLEAVVTASGTIQPKRSVNISAETVGKVVEVSVVEGQHVKAGQPLLQIDPRNLETQVQNREASLASALSQLEQTRAQIENSRVALQQSRDTLRRQEELWKAGLIPRETYERAVHDLAMRETDLKVMDQSVNTQLERIKQEEANLASSRHDLTKVRVSSPIAGIVTRLNVEEGETAVVGTMNNAGTVLLTIADLSVLETEIEVDETDIPYIGIGQSAKVTIDAMPGRTFTGQVTEVGNSPIQAAGAAATGRATNFKVVVTIDGEVPDVRPGFTCTAVITTATRENTLAVPIQSMTVREFVVDAAGAIVRTARGRTGGTGPTTGRGAPAELAEGQERKELEGVFLVRDAHAVFVPVKIGIAGDRYFEVIDGLSVADEVITGPFESVRNLRDGDAVQATATRSPTRPAARTGG